MGEVMGVAVNANHKNGQDVAYSVSPFGCTTSRLMLDLHHIVKIHAAQVEPRLELTRALRGRPKLEILGK